jgi:hypothetical protein
MLMPCKEPLGQPRSRITDALRRRQPLNRALSILSLPGRLAGIDQSIAASEAAGPEAAHRHSIFVHHLVSAPQELSERVRVLDGFGNAILFRCTARPQALTAPRVDL